MPVISVATHVFSLPSYYCFCSNLSPMYHSLWPVQGLSSTSGLKNTAKLPNKTFSWCCILQLSSSPFYGQSPKKCCLPFASVFLDLSLYWGVSYVSTESTLIKATTSLHVAKSYGQFSVVHSSFWSTLQHVFQNILFLLSLTIPFLCWFFFLYSRAQSQDPLSSMPIPST